MVLPQLIFVVRDLAFRGCILWYIFFFVLLCSYKFAVSIAQLGYLIYYLYYLFLSMSYSLLSFVFIEREFILQFIFYDAFSWLLFCRMILFFYVLSVSWVNSSCVGSSWILIWIISFISSDYVWYIFFVACLFFYICLVVLYIRLDIVSRYLGCSVIMVSGLVAFGASNVKFAVFL